MKGPISAALSLVSVITLTAPFVGLTGCRMADGLDSESVTTKTSALVLTRQHHEEIDPQDGLFVTYWERRYDLGSAAMDVIPNGYNATVDYTAVTEISNPNFVVGKGRSVCWGEVMNWQINGTPSVTALGVYGWLESPLVEYYIGRDGGSGTIAVGTYSTGQGTYELHVTNPERANILNPENSPDLPRKFLQFNAKSLDGVPATVGPVDLSQHYEAWERLMGAWWPTKTDWSSQGWSWYPLVLADYCVVATEIFGPRTGNASVSNIAFEERTTVDPIAQAVSPLGTQGSPLIYKVTSSEPWNILQLSLDTFPWAVVSPTSGGPGITIVTVLVDSPNPFPLNERGANLDIQTNGTTVAGIQIFQFYDGEGWVPSPAGGGLPFEISRNGPWSAASGAPDWLSVTPNSGTNGTYGLFISATANTGATNRSASVTITGGGDTKAITVTQAPLKLYTDPMSVAVAPPGGTNSFKIHSNVNWWSAYTTDGGGWLSINPGSYSGAGNGTVSFTATPNNTGQTRTATITVAGGDVTTRIVPITQGSTPPPPCDPSNRLVNPGFESGTTGWTTWAGSLSTTGSPVHTGAKSGRVTNRTASWQGPVQDLIGKVTAGHTYRAEAWAKVSGFSSQPLAITLKSQCAGGSPVYTPLNGATGNNWTHLSGQFTVPSCSLVALAIYVEGPAAGVTLYADDASVAEICP